MSDIFQEVDEEVRRERLEKLWQRYQNHVFALIVLILAGVGAWRAYEWWDAKKSAEAGAAFESAIALADAGKHADAETAFAKVATEGTAAYRTMARLREAAELAQTDAKAAVSAYEKIAADGAIGSEWRDLAGVRAAALLIDAGSFSEARKQLEPLAEKERPYRHTARELLALAAWRAGDIAGARHWFEIIVTDVLTPADIRDRVEMLIALVNSEKA